jgi:tetratricopeptide (TPR) repeat protein
LNILAIFPIGARSFLKWIVSPRVRECYIKSVLLSFELSSDQDDRDSGRWSNKGADHFLKGEYEEAIKDFDKALEINPDHAEALYFRSRLKVKKGDNDEGLVDLEKAIKVKIELKEVAKSDKLFRSIRNEQRFKALVE